LSVEAQSSIGASLIGLVFGTFSVGRKTCRALPGMSRAMVQDWPGLRPTCPISTQRGRLQNKTMMEPYHEFGLASSQRRLHVVTCFVPSPGELNWWRSLSRSHVRWRWFLSYHSPDHVSAGRLRDAIERNDPGSRTFFALTNLSAGGVWSGPLAR